MHKGLLVVFFIFTSLTFAQVDEPILDSLSKSNPVFKQLKDSLVGVSSELESSKDSITQELQKQAQKSKKIKKPKKQKIIPYIKPMEEVTVSDYKILYLDGTEKSVDTSLSLNREYTFNFLQTDYFEYLPLPNMGEGFNQLGYDFQDQPMTPQMGASAKHFGYFEKEDIPYYNMPSAYTELFFKTTFQQGQHLDATLAINTSPKFNVAVSFRGFRSEGKYTSSLSRARQFRMSTQYETYDQRYRMRLHQTTQSIENDFNGGLTNNSVYFFENAPNYVVADESGQPILNENGEEEFFFYDGFLDRSQLETQTKGLHILEGKGYFMDHQYRLFPLVKDSTAYKMSIGYRAHYETKNYQLNQRRTDSYFYEAYSNGAIADTTLHTSLENTLYAKLENSALGSLQLNLHQQQWNYSFAPDEYEKDTILPTQLKANQLAIEAQWAKSLFGLDARLAAYNSLRNDYATRVVTAEIERTLFKEYNLKASYSQRSKPLNFNFYLSQSDYKEYNWYNPDLKNQFFDIKRVILSHPKWGKLSTAWTNISDYAFFNNTTLLRNLNKNFKLEVVQIDKKIDYFKARFDQRLDFKNFSWVNNIQYQEVIQEENPDELLSGPLALNVPKWLIRSTFMLTSSLFNKALFFQSGATFVYFTDYYADQYNPLIAEFITQNNTKIGNYPRVDFFFNAKIKTSRLFIKLENVNAPIEHLISPDTLYDYYAAPFTPYRDFSLRVGLIWNFFE